MRIQHNGRHNDSPGPLWWLLVGCMFLVLLKPQLAHCQIVVIQGSDTVAASRTTINNNFAYLDNNKVYKFSGIGVPGSIPRSGLGDLYYDTSGQNVYACFILTGSCSTVAGGNWVKVNGTGGGGAVNSVFGRTGAVLAASGDYTASQVTNAADTTGSYANPAWITSLAAAKITGLAPSATIDTTNANNITSGVLAPARGGLGISLATTGGAHQYLQQFTLGGNVSVGQPSASDISGLAASATTDTTNAANITSGTLPAGRLPNPTASTLGGTQALLPVAHNFLTGISLTGVPSAAQPAATDITGLAPSATIDTTNAANITSGTLLVARGGTGAGSFTAHGVLFGEGTSPFATAVDIITGGLCLTSVIGGDPTWQTCPGAGGGAAFSAISSGVNTTATMTVGTGATLVPAGTGILTANSLVDGSAWAGSSVLTNIGTPATPAAGHVSVYSSTANQALQAINESGIISVMAITKSAVTHQFLNAMLANGGFTSAQPAAADITGLAPSATTDTTNAGNISTGALPVGRLPAFIGDVTSSAGSNTLTITSVATAGSCGDTTHSCGFTLNAKGQITGALTNNVISASVHNLSYSTVAYATSLTIDTQTADVFTVTLTGDVSSTTLNYAGGAVPTGRQIYLRIIQDSSGNHNFALPAATLSNPNWGIFSAGTFATMIPLVFNGSQWEFFAPPEVFPTV